MSKQPKTVMAFERLVRSLTGHKTAPIPLAFAVLVEALVREANHSATAPKAVKTQLTAKTSKKKPLKTTQE